jgi:hypothetical protein
VASIERAKIASTFLVIQGWLLLVVAGIHLWATSLLRRVVAHELSASQFTFIWPSFALSFIVLGILLIPLGLSTLVCAGGIRRRERWAWTIAMINALAVLSLPLTLFLVMDRAYFRAVPFLVATILVTAVGLSMAWPLLWVRREILRRS